MHLRQGTLPPEVKEYPIHVKISPTGPFKFPECTELVSGLYLIETPMKCEKIKIQHCAAAYLEHALTFVECTQVNVHTKQFKFLEGGQFPSDQYGSVRLRHTSIVGIVFKCDSTSMPAHTAYQPKSSRRYLARLYYSNRDINTWEAYFIITWKLDILLSVSIQTNTVYLQCIW